MKKFHISAVSHFKPLSKHYVVQNFKRSLHISTRKQSPSKSTKSVTLHKFLARRTLFADDTSAQAGKQIVCAINLVVISDKWDDAILKLRYL
jgi:hypothetical protein